MSSHVSPQVLHFFIGLGALVSPLVADPFLSEGSCVLAANWTSNSSTSDIEHLRSRMVPGAGMLFHNSSHYPLHTEGTSTTRVSFAFWIMALINVSVLHENAVTLNRLCVTFAIWTQIHVCMFTWKDSLIIAWIRFLNTVTDSIQYVSSNVLAWDKQI